MIAEYRGLTVAEMTELRTEARNAGVYMKVVKNSLARRAVEGTPFECIQPSLRGPLLLAFSREDPGSAARVVKGFSKDHANLVTGFAGGGRGALRRDEPGPRGGTAEPGRGAGDAAENP